MTSLVTPAATLPTIEKLTRENILTRFLTKGGFGFQSTATADASDKTYLQDSTRLQGRAISEGLRNNWVRISQAGSADPEGDIRAIKKIAQDEGRLEPVSAFSAAVTEGDKYQIFKVVDPQDVLDIIDYVLTDDVYLPHLAVLSEVPDYDMEQDNTTDWTDDGATGVKDTAEPNISGVRYLKVTDGGSGNGYTRTVKMPVQPGRGFHASALVRCTAGTTQGKIVVHDETNNAVLASQAFQQMNWGRVYINSVTVPEDCYEVSIRCTTVTASGVTWWDDVVFYSVGGGSISLPWWVKDEDQVKGVFRLVPREGSANIWEPSLLGRREHGWDPIPNSSFGGGQLGLTSRHTVLTYPLFIYGTRSETAFSSETEVKHLDATFMHALLCREVYAQLKGLPGSGSLNVDSFEDLFKHWDRERDRELRKQEKTLQKLERAPENQTMYSRADPYDIFTEGETGSTGVYRSF